MATELKEATVTPDAVEGGRGDDLVLAGRDKSKSASAAESALAKSLERDVLSAGLTKYLRKVRREFDTDALLRQQPDREDIVQYYEDSDYAFRLFHSTEGSIHMALNFDGKFDKQGYYGQAKIVQKHIDQTKPRRVLELGSGKGFNSIYLAEQNSGIEFVGVDITPPHVATSQNRARHIANLRFEIEDFQDLSFPSESFDLVFVVESLCHAIDMTRALAEVHRVLAPGGRFIVIDGFREPDFDQLGDDVRTAARLVEVAMAINNPFVIDDWVRLAQQVGYKVLSVEDISPAILPNLMRFQWLARAYFKYKPVSRILKKVLPLYVIKNAIAGLLMPFTVRAGAQGYYVISLERGGSDGSERRV